MEEVVNKEALSEGYNTDDLQMKVCDIFDCDI